MAADIIPIQLGLTAGNGYTLWAPRWIEDGEEWEAFLGHGDDLYVFPTPAHLAAFVRTSTEHDLIDHPEWESVLERMVDELTPDEDHEFDIVGVPNLVAETPDIWTLAELSDTVAILRSLADVCDLEPVSDLLDSSEGFDAARFGEQAFAGRAGERLWDEVGTTVVKGWDAVVDALDSLVTTPEVDAAALEKAQQEAAATTVAHTGIVEEPEEERDPDLEFWDGIGIDCIEVRIGERTGRSLRCYLGDDPVFLTRAGRLLIWTDDEAMENFLADPASEHALVNLEVWPQVRDAIRDGEAVVVAGPENTYVLDGVGEALRMGPGNIGANQLALANELLTDAATARGDEQSLEALSSATPLSRLITVISRPDPELLAPVPPFDAEADQWIILVERFGDWLEWDPTTT